MTPDNTSVEQRATKVDELFNKIALMAQIYESNPQQRDELIKPMVAELWAITQEQEKLHELDYKRVGEPTSGEKLRML
jgi:hypothetical protein